MADDPFTPKIDPNADPFAPPKPDAALADRDEPATFVPPEDASIADGPEPDDAPELHDPQDIVDYVNRMRKKGVPKEKVQATLVRKGFPERESRTVVENLYNAPMSESVPQEHKTGARTLAIGIIFLILGIAATAASMGSRIWIGAIVVGAIETLYGIVQIIRGK